MKKTNSKTPGNLEELLQVAGRSLWHSSKVTPSYSLTAFRNVEQFIKTVGNLQLSEVTTLTIDEFVTAHAGKVSGATLNRKLTNVHSILEFAVERQWIERMPSFKKKWSKESKGRIRWVTVEEEEKMLSFLSTEPEVKRFITVLIDTGLRRGELLGLQPQDVDNGWIRLWKTKNGEARSVPMSDRVKEALAEGLPFKLDEDKLRKVWDALRVHMGFQGERDFVLHSLRHTAATRALSKTRNLAVVQKMLGHRQITTTLRYAHISDEDLMAAVR